ncbi:hypothetical protein JHK85_007805 [Glycine max]|nr:hypothetical protein JHK85_007805 [Glycine max]
MSVDNIGKDDNIDEEALNQENLYKLQDENAEHMPIGFEVAFPSLLDLAIKKYWTEKGICWARNSEVQDIDDTAMGFRLLRLHGHQVSPAFQVLLQGEKILEYAKNFYAKFLTEKCEANELLDKWIMTKDLPGEVLSDTLRTYLKMPYVNNDVYLQLAKLDYSNCQAVHCVEWEKNPKAQDSGNGSLSPTSITTSHVESDIQELVQLVLQNSSDGMHSNVKN